MITEPFLCDWYFFRYLWKCKAEGNYKARFVIFLRNRKKSKSLEVNTIVKTPSNQTFTMFINPVKVWFEGILTIVLTFRDFDFSKSWQTWLFIISLYLTFSKISEKVLITQKWFSYHLKCQNNTKKMRYCLFISDRHKCF